MSEATISELGQLATVITKNSTPLIKSWRSKVKHLSSAKNLDKPALTDHIPDFLNELTRALLDVPEDTKACDLGLLSAPAHGLQRVQVGFDIEDVVTEYHILRDCIHDLADEHHIAISGMTLRVLNCVIDGAIAMAVRSYALESTLEVQRRREEYLSFVAHDLRTPLNAVSLATKLLEESSLDRANPVVQKAFKSLHRNVHHLAVLTNSILEENINLEAESGIQLACRHIDLWPLVESLLHSLHPVAGTANTTLVNNIPEDLVVYADAALLRRVFQNLLANAIQHSPRGIVTVSAKLADGNGSVMCKVDDTGAGIASDKLLYIFDKYETGGTSEDGLGLGLTICKVFVEAHGGTITVDSIQGAGTKFSFVLPPKQ